MASLAEAGWLDLEPDGRVAGAAGLSLAKGPHRLSLGPHAFRPWCAYDALGIPAALSSHGEVVTTCGHCGTELRVTFRSGTPQQSGPELLWLAEGGNDLRASFCTPTVLLCVRSTGARGLTSKVVAATFWTWQRPAGAAGWTGPAALMQSVRVLA